MPLPDGPPSLTPANPTLVQRLALRFGRRGLKLISAGVAWLLYGGIVAFDKPPVERFSRPGMGPLDWADSPWFAALWWACGLVCFIIGIRRSRFDAFGFAVAVAPPLAWSALYGYSAAVWLFTGGMAGTVEHTATVTLWLLFAFMLRVDAGWDDPTDPIRIPPDWEPR